MSEDGLYLKLFGFPEVFWKGEPISAPSAKPFALLCYLAMQKDFVSRKELAELLWDANKNSSVRVALHTLKQLPFADNWLIMEDQLVRLEAESDVKRFENQLDAGDLAAAFEIWHGQSGQLLKGLEVRDAVAFEEWLELERFRLHQRYLNALKDHAHQLEKSKHYAEAIQLYQRFLDQDPLNEDSHRTIMRLAHLMGEKDRAIEQFERCRQILQKELGVEPTEETLALLRDIEMGAVTQSKSALLLKKAQDVPALPSRLIGREKLFEELLGHLEAKERVLLQGFGGSGKSAIAATLAAHYLEHAKDVLWLEVGNDALDSLFDAIAKALDAQKKLSQASNHSKAKIMQEILKTAQIDLLVLDDVWNAYALSKIMEILPKDMGLLVTSRQRYPKLKRLEVGNLARSAALELLEHYAENPLAKDKQASQLCDILGDHAFALRITGVTLKEDQLSPKDLYKRIKDAPHNLKLPEELVKDGRDSIVSLLQVSLESLSDEAHEAFMAMGALFTSSSTPELLALLTRRSAEESEEALIELQRRALTERVSEAGSDVVSYRMHDLAFSLARANNAIRKSTTVRACKAFTQTYQQDFDTLESEINNILSAAQHARDKKDYENFIKLMELLVIGVNSYFVARGHSPRSLELLEYVANLSHKEGKLESAHYFYARLGDFYRRSMANMTEAYKAYDISLKLAEDTQNKHREAILLSLIGSLCFLGKLGESQPFFEKAYQLAKANQDDLALSHVLQNMSYVAGVTKDFKRANTLCHEAVEVARRQRKVEYDENSRAKQNLFFALLNLGESQKHLGNSDKSYDSYKEALEIAQESNNELWIALTWQEIAEVHHARGERVLAENYYKKALGLYQQNHVKASIEFLTNFMKQEGYQVLSDFTPT